MVCCDVSSLLLQHGAHELKKKKKEEKKKKTLGHYILLSGIHTVQWTRHFGFRIAENETGASPGCLRLELRFSSGCHVWLLCHNIT